MSIVTIKTKGQVTLPARLRAEIGLQIGDILEATIEKGKITLTPKSIIDKRLEESIADFKAGKSRGPFNSATEMVSDMKKQVRKIIK